MKKLNTQGKAENQTTVMRWVSTEEIDSLPNLEEEVLVRYPYPSQRGYRYCFARLTDIIKNKKGFEKKWFLIGVYEDVQEPTHYMIIVPPIA